MLRRKAESKLLEWKSRTDRKPLLVRGVRQCGKTHLLRHAAMDMFENVAYVNLENDPAARADFLSGLDPRRIVTSLEARTGQRIVPGKTLIVIDEVQACELLGVPFGVGLGHIRRGPSFARYPAGC